MPGLKPENDGFADSLVRKITGENQLEKYHTELRQVNFKKKDIVQLYVVMVQLNKLTKQMNT